MYRASFDGAKWNEILYNFNNESERFISNRTARLGGGR
jgi:hypothetical protein